MALQAQDPPPGAPTVTTGSATGISTTEATLNGTVSPNGLPTTYYFEYGTSTAYGATTASTSAGRGRNTANVSATISGLTPGTPYHFRIVATNSSGATFGADSTFTTTGNPAPPVAAFTYSPSSPVVGSPVTFNASSSSCAATPCSYTWTINGTMPMGVTVSYTFQQVGIYSVALTVMDALGRSSSVEHDVLVSAPPPPVAAFTYSPSSPVVGSPVTFNASSSSCTATPCSYTWTINGTMPMGVMVPYTFQQAGTYPITLTVMDALGRSSSVEHDVVVTASTAITYYVSNSGNDANSGTSSSPWRTIQRAANTVSAGATVVVTAGTYNERVNVSNSGSSSSPITFEAQGKVVMQGFSIGGSYVIVDGFEPSNIAANGFNPAAYAGIYSSGNYNIIRNNYSHNNGSWGVYLDISASFNQVLNNVMAYNGHLGIWVRGSDDLIQKNDISHSIQFPANWRNPPSWSDADGISFEGDGHIFRGNYIHDITLTDAGNVCRKACPHRDAFQMAGIESSDVIVEGNLIHIPYREAWTSQMMMLSGTVTNLMVRNNIIYNTDRGPNMVGTIVGMKVENNTFVNITDYAVDLDSTGGNDVLVRNNIFRNVRTPAVGFNPPATATQDHNFTGDPLFVNEAGLDFHLQSGSPAIDTGLTTPDVTQDFDGISRPQGASTDIGAYESHNP